MTFICDDPMDFDDYSDGVTCPKCNGWRTVNCYCGGDQCYCNNNGEKDCPLCYGEGEVSEESADAYLKKEREMYAAFAKVFQNNSGRTNGG